MYFVVIRRVIKRKVNTEEEHLIGPFVYRRTAEKALIRAAGTYTCLGATVVDEAHVRERYSRRSYLPFSQAEMYQKAVGLLPKEAEPEEVSPGS